MAAIDPNKAKIARRVIEVLEFFDEHRGQATVMDIARRYNRPQSSTSELLAILVEMGLLYKDPGTRSYTPTPRAAMLGSLSQPSLIRDGRLSMLLDRLAAQTGLGTALTGMIGLNAQIFRWMAGSKTLETSLPDGFSGGLQDRLCESVAGWLLLSTIPADRREGVIHRLRAETPAHRKFSQALMSERIQECGRQACAVGPAGFGTTAEMAAVLLPSEASERPIVLGFVYQPCAEIEPAALVDLLQKAIQRSLNQWNYLNSQSANNGALNDTAVVKSVPSAA